jgi:hypothetical protein
LALRQEELRSRRSSTALVKTMSELVMDVNIPMEAMPKQRPRRYEFADREPLLHVIEDILRGIEKMIWKTSFSAGWRDSPMW